MSIAVNQSVYRVWAPVYDLLFRRISASSRGQAIDLLRLKPGESLLILGIGTGLDLPLLPKDLAVTGLDFSQAMLARAHRRIFDACTVLVRGDAGRLPFQTASCDAVLFNLVLSVVPDPLHAFCESWRVLRLDGRAAIFDKFLPEGGKVTAKRKLVGTLIRALGTDPNRKLSEIIAGVSDVSVVHDAPTLLHGQYRVLLLKKSSVQT